MLQTRLRLKHCFQRSYTEFYISTASSRSLPIPLVFAKRYYEVNERDRGFRTRLEFRSVAFIVYNNYYGG